MTNKAPMIWCLSLHRAEAEETANEEMSDAEDDATKSS